MNENTEKILVKYLMNTANIDDLEVLTKWLKDDHNKEIFKDYIKTNFAMDINANKFNTENAKKEYLRKIRHDKKLVHRLKIYKVLKYAAAATLVFGLGYFFQKGFMNGPIKDVPVIVNTSIEPGTDKATLTLGDGSHITLEKGASFQSKNVSSNGEEIVYKDKDQNVAEIVYNYLTIPRAGQFHIVLSDGTEVWLNSESQLKYPVAFIEGETRKVELIYGEAYFDVSPSSLHKGSKFKVFNQSQEIEVLGTQFNIKAYKDESNIYTTLVEGKVAVTFNGGKENLVPNQQFKLNVMSGNVTIGSVDVYNEISWKEGVFSFEGKPLKDIVKVLSRWYDVDFVFENETAKEKRFNGSLNKNLKIKEILDIIKNFEKIKGYEINEKTIMIK